MTCFDIAERIGQRSLFVGIESYGQGAAWFAGVAQFARSYGVDTLLVKVADGTRWWYGGLDGYRARRDAIKAQGVGVVPYTYSYGNKFGALDAEIDILIELMKEDGVVCMDAEEEWNGHTDWASHLCARLQGVPGTFLVSTWGNPAQQNWAGIVRALNPVVAAWMPQQYTNYLASCWAQYGDLGAQCLMPTVDLSDGFGPNDPAAIATAACNQGHAALSVWYHATAMNNPGLLDQVLAAFPRTSSQEGDRPMNITDPFAAAHFRDLGGEPRRWRCIDKGHEFDIIGGILGYWRKTQGAFRLPCSNEIYDIVPGVVIQFFEGGPIVWDPGGILDNPGLGPAYAPHLDTDSPILRQLIARAGLTLATDALPAGQIEAARNGVGVAINALSACVANLHNIAEDLQPPAIAVVAAK